MSTDKIHKPSGWPPLLLAEFGTHFGLPEIKFVVNDGNEMPWLLKHKYEHKQTLIVGRSARSDFRYDPAPMSRDHLWVGDLSVADLLDFTGLEKASGDEESFIDSWDEAVARYNQFLAGEIEPASAKIIAFKPRG